MTEPDAWMWERYRNSKTASTTKLTEEHPEDVAEKLVEDNMFESFSELNMVPKSERRLFSAETIIQVAHQLMIDEIDRAMEKYGADFGVDYTPIDFADKLEAKLEEEFKQKGGEADE